MNVERLARELTSHLVLTRPLVCVDLEATGVWPGHDRIVQIAAASIFPDGSVSTWSSLVNPEQPMPPAAQAIHGITDAMVASAPTFAQLSETVGALLSGCDLTGYNVERFDRRLLAAEFRRAGVADPTVDALVIDACTIFVRQEPRSLDAALRFYGVEEGQAHRQAHDASSDVEATVAVLAAQLSTYDDLPNTVEALHDWLHPDRSESDRRRREAGVARRRCDCGVRIASGHIPCGPGSQRPQLSRMGTAQGFLGRGQSHRPGRTRRAIPRQRRGRISEGPGLSFRSSGLRDGQNSGTSCTASKSTSDRV